MKNIFYKGRIYLNVKQYPGLLLKSDEEYLQEFQSIPVSGNVTWQDFKEVTEEVDYDKGPDKDFILVARPIK